MKYYVIFTLLLSYQIAFCQQNNTADTIHWRANYKLKWEDFQAFPDTNSIGGAGTASALVTFSNYTSDTSICIIAKAVFYRKKSWVKAHWNTSYSLNHEQGHFDITEVYARKLNALFKKYKFNKSTVNKDINQIFDTVLKEKNTMQELYDSETTRPINPTKQKQWDRKIATWLKQASKL